MSDLEEKVNNLTAQTEALSRRLSEVEQLNIRLRKALDFGKPVTMIEGSSGITYSVIALEGSKKEKVIIIRMQVSTKNDVNTLMLAYGFEKPSIVDVNGTRYEAQETEIGGTGLLEIYRGVPVNASITFKGIEPESVVDIKLLKVTNTVDYSSSDQLLFKNLKVDWK